MARKRYSRYDHVRGALQDLEDGLDPARKAAFERILHHVLQLEGEEMSRVEQSHRKLTEQMAKLEATVARLNKLLGFLEFFRQYVDWQPPGWMGRVKGLLPGRAVRVKSDG